MKKIRSFQKKFGGLAAAGLALALTLAGCGEPDTVTTTEAATTAAWLSWRGDQQCGMSLETGLPEKVTLDGPDHLWSYALSGRPMYRRRTDR